MANTNPPDLRGIAYEAMRRYGFEADFPAPVMAEAAALSAVTSLDGRRDMRGLAWSSIDNESSLDLDQLEHCEPGEDGRIIVRVAIADVDALVAVGCETDQHALRNTTSVYAGIRLFPMLPDRLSEDLTSLKEGADRPALVVEFSVLPDGTVVPSSIYKALVRNKARLVYEEIGGWLEGRAPLPVAAGRVEGLQEQLRLQDEAARRLRSFRLAAGALELETIEPRLVVLQGEVTDLCLTLKTRASYLIENFMIAANRTIACVLSQAGIPTIERVVCAPKDWEGIRREAGRYNEQLPAEPDSRALSQFLFRRKLIDPRAFPEVSLAVVKLLGPGEYAVLGPGAPSIGHFGLAVSDYTHATAPNRRYVDIIIQRQLKAMLAGEQAPYTLERLKERAAWCTEREKEAKKVERFMRKAASASVLVKKLGQTFDAIVTGASGKGCYVRIFDPPVEGRVVRGEAGLSVGMRVRVRLDAVDPWEGYIDFVKVV